MLDYCENTVRAHLNVAAQRMVLKNGNILLAIYHLNAKIIGRNQGKSAVAAAAYRAAENLYSVRQDIAFDFHRKRGVPFSEILHPENVPAWVSDREKLWNHVELNEKRKDATYAREVEVALPIELTFEQHKDLLREFINETFVKLGMVADYSIHDVNGKNPHAHIMLTMRSIDENGFGKKVREWNDKRLFISWREQWAEVNNKHLKLNGFDKRISHLSYEDQGINLEPTIHRGYMSRSNQEVLDRFQKAKSIIERNYERLVSDPTIGIDLLTQHESVFSHHDLARFVNERTNSVEEFNILKAAIESSHDLVLLGEGLDKKTYYTSKKVLTQERSLMTLAEQFAKRARHKLNPAKYDFILKQRTLTQEQRKAFEFILSGQDMSLVVGFAGTGKSYLMDTVREAYEAAGYRVVGTALSGRAADGLMSSASISSKTIARFLLDWTNGREQLTKHTVLVIDEIGMVGTRQFLALLSEADRVGAKVICCGDPEQIPPVEAGSPFRFLLERINHIKLTNVIRQKIIWQREATIELSTQRHHKAIDRYHEHGLIHEYKSREEARQRLVEHWYRYNQYNPNKSAVMMSYRNIDVLAMNLMAREMILQNQSVSKPAVKVNTKSFGEIEMVEGERIMFLRNENSLGVKNGMLGTIQSVDDSSISIALDKGGIVSFDHREYKDLSYGYAATIHKLQGETVDQSYVLAIPKFDRFLTNVALDRHRESVELYYGQDDFKSYDNLKRTLSRGDSKILAVEFAQSRGIDYEEKWDKAANFQSKQDFNKYYEDVLANSVPATNTKAKDYLQNLGIKNIPDSLRFNPSVWDKAIQDFAPAIVVPAVGKGEEGSLVTKGVDVIFISNDSNTKTVARYNGSLDGVVMLQKASKPDQRWFITDNIETGLIIAEANREIRVAYIPKLQKLNKLPMNLSSKNEIVYCRNKNMKSELPKALEYLCASGIKVNIANPQNQTTFRQELLMRGNKSVLDSLTKATRIHSISRGEVRDNEVER